MSRRCWIILASVAQVIVGGFSVAGAEPELPYVTLPTDQSVSVICLNSHREAAAILPLALMCETDSDCVLYPCSCSAIGTNDDAKRYLELVRLLQHDCRAAVTYLHCGATTPICGNGICTTRSSKE